MPPRQRLMTGALLLNSLAWCVLGQYYLSNLPEYRLDAAIFYVLGLLSFWRVLVRLGAPALPAPPVDDAPPEPLSQRWPLVFASVGLAALAYANLANNVFTRLGVLTWIGSILFLLAAVWPAPQPATERRPWAAGRLPLIRAEGITIRLTWRAAALLAILLLAAFFRLYRLDDAPPEMTSDHVEKLLDIRDLAGGARPIYFERNTGREPFQFYWTFTVMRLFNTGITFYGLKLANALIGIVTVYGIYLLGREVAGEGVGLLAACFASVMQWAESITRMGLRFPYATIAATFTLWALFRALRTGRRADYALAGLIFGAGFYGYTAYRVMPVALAVVVTLKLLFERPRSRPAWRQLALNLAVYVCIAGLVFVPLGRYWHDRPAMFWYRSASRIYGEYGATLHDAGATLVHNTLRALGMFNVTGDIVWANTIPGQPTLDQVGGALLVLSVLSVIYGLARPNASGQKRHFPLLATSLAGIVLLLPSILSLAFPNENPSVVRTAGAIPVVAVLVGLGLYTAADALRRVGGPRLGTGLAATLLLVLLTATTLINYRRYFVDYVYWYQVSSQNSSEIAQVMRGFIATGGDLKHIVLHSWPHWVDTRALALILGDMSWHENNVVVDHLEDLGRLRDDPAPQLYLLHVKDEAGLAMLQSIFPQGYMEMHHSPIPGRDFVLFLVPKRNAPREG